MKRLSMLQRGFCGASAGCASDCSPLLHFPCVWLSDSLHSVLCPRSVSRALPLTELLLYPLNNHNLFPGFLFLVLVVWMPHIVESHSVCLFVVDLLHFAQCILVGISSLKAPVTFYPAHLSLGCTRGTSVGSDIVQHFALEHIISLSAFLSLKFRFLKKKLFSE